VRILYNSGANPGFQVRGGAPKKIAPSRGRRENFWGISCEKSRFYAKYLYDLITKRNLRFIIFEAKGEQAVNV
jgi:hypothetical protein